MLVSLSIIRYPRWAIPFALLAMAVHRIPLYLHKRISFFKLMGSGKNGSFDKRPDWRQWGILTVRTVKDKVSADHKMLYGPFIDRWYRSFDCEVWTIILEPIEGHGLWDGKPVFGDLPRTSHHEGYIGILTRATIRLNKLQHFWKNVPSVADAVHNAPGLVTSFGIGEIPWIKQATFSVWQTKEHMEAFAYGMKAHTGVIAKTREQGWFKEELFVRFRVIESRGTVKGVDPLKVKL